MTNHLTLFITGLLGGSLIIESESIELTPQFSSYIGTDIQTLHNLRNLSPDEIREFQIRVLRSEVFDSQCPNIVQNLERYFLEMDRRLFGKSPKVVVLPSFFFTILAFIVFSITLLMGVFLTYLLIISWNFNA